MKPPEGIADLGSQQAKRTVWCVIPLSAPMWQRVVREGQDWVPVAGVFAYLFWLPSLPRLILKNIASGELAVARYLGVYNRRRMRVSQAVVADPVYRLGPSSVLYPSWVASPNLPVHLKRMVGRLHAKRGVKTTRSAAGQRVAGKSRMTLKRPAARVRRPPGTTRAATRPRATPSGRVPARTAVAAAGRTRR